MQVFLLLSAQTLLIDTVATNRVTDFFPFPYTSSHRHWIHEQGTGEYTGGRKYGTVTRCLQGRRPSCHTHVYSTWSGSRHDRFPLSRETKWPSFRIPSRKGPHRTVMDCDRIVLRWNHNQSMNDDRWSMIDDLVWSCLNITMNNEHTDHRKTWLPDDLMTWRSDDLMTVFHPPPLLRSYRVIRVTIRVHGTDHRHVCSTVYLIAIVYRYRFIWTEESLLRVTFVIMVKRAQTSQNSPKGALTLTTKTRTLFWLHEKTMYRSWFDHGLINRPRVPTKVDTMVST